MPCSAFVYFYFLFLHRQGIPVPFIHLLFDDALSCCLEEARKNCISLDDLDKIEKHRMYVGNFCPVQESKRKDLLVRNSVKNQPICSSIGSEPNRILKNHNCNPAKGQTKLANKSPINRYSRHSVDDFITENQNNIDNVTRVRTEQLCVAVSRGNSTVASLLEEILKSITHGEQLSKMNISTDYIITQVVSNKPVRSSFVFEGVCLSTSAMDLDYFGTFFKGKPAVVCLIDFDRLTYAAKLPEKSPLTTEKYDQHPVGCFMRATGILKLSSLNVSCVITKGGTAAFIEECHSYGIATLKVSSHKQLQILSNATGSSIVSSVDEFDQTDIGLPVNLSIVQEFYESKLPNQLRKEDTVLIAVDLSTYDIQARTVIICGTTCNIAQLQEESFWRAIFKLQNVLRSGKALVGCGETEAKCATELRCRKGASFL